MKVFADTSGIFAALVADDGQHEVAAKVLHRLLDIDATLVTTGAVVFEAMALLQTRVGFAAARAFERDFRPRLDVAWVDEGLYDKGIRRWLLRGSRAVSLVDCLSFVLMEETGVLHALAFDKHFEQEGFTLLTPGAFP